MIYFLSLIMPFIVDRITKLAALAYLHDPIFIAPCISLVLVKNRGISWGMLSSEGSLLFMLTTAMNCTIVIVLSIIAYKHWRLSKPIVAHLLVISGAASNIVDRFWYGGVIDFIELSCNGYRFPVFNIADCAIVFGGAMMLYGYWKNQ